jgi:hypothetical protein
MSNIDDWPQAAVLAGLPATARLKPSYDSGLLRADVARVSGAAWAYPRIVDGNGVGEYATQLDWRTLPLRSIGGSADRTDPGGPELAEFADTPLRAQVPYLSQVIDSLPAPVCSARLMALGPGAQSPVHLDTKWGLPWGKVRLHVPIVTTPDAVLEIAGSTMCWSAGELWYADFTRLHVVRNTGPVTRIHLVVDCLATRELLGLFPDPFQAPEVIADFLLACDAAPLPAADQDALRCTFAMPASFRSYEQPDGELLAEKTMVPAAIDKHQDGLALYLGGEPTLALVHVGGREFRFAGWTAERTLQVSADHGPGLEVTLRTRVGARTRQRTLPATALI